MNTNLICSFKSGENALAWAVVEQAIFDYLSTNNEQDKEDIISFLLDYLPSYKFHYIFNLINDYDTECDSNG